MSSCRTSFATHMEMSNPSDFAFFHFGLMGDWKCGLTSKTVILIDRFSLMWARDQIWRLPFQESQALFIIWKCVGCMQMVVFPGCWRNPFQTWSGLWQFIIDERSQFARSPWIFRCVRVMDVQYRRGFLRYWEEYIVVYS